MRLGVLIVWCGCVVYPFGCVGLLVLGPVVRSIFNWIKLEWKLMVCTPFRRSLAIEETPTKGQANWSTKTVSKTPKNYHFTSRITQIWHLLARLAEPKPMTTCVTRNRHPCQVSESELRLSKSLTISARPARKYHEVFSAQRLLFKFWCRYLRERKVRWTICCRRCQQRSGASILSHLILRVLPATAFNQTNVHSMRHSTVRSTYPVITVDCTNRKSSWKQRCFLIPKKAI